MNSMNSLNLLLEPNEHNEHNKLNELLTYLAPFPDNTTFIVSKTMTRSNSDDKFLI